VASHRIEEEWMGNIIITLEDLLRPGLRAVCVGINPSPVSVAAGHYYQGQLGQRFFGRLRRIGMLPEASGSFDDDVAFAAGIGFTDIVKRPSPSARGLAPAEFRHGRHLLEAKLDTIRPRLVVFTFKQAARVLFGSFTGSGFVSGLGLGQSQVFVMPAPFERRETADATLRALAEAVE
jgi:double-stranded uracil-DNA glycosylase